MKAAILGTILKLAAKINIILFTHLSKSEQFDFCLKVWAIRGYAI